MMLTSPQIAIESGPSHEELLGASSCGRDKGRSSEVTFSGLIVAPKEEGGQGLRRIEFFARIIDLTEEVGRESSFIVRAYLFLSLFEFENRLVEFRYNAKHGTGSGFRFVSP